MAKTQTARVDDILSITAVIQGHNYNCDIDADLNIGADLDTELMRQPGKFAWYAAMSEYAMDAYQRAKSEMERLTAELDQEKRQEAAESGEKVTEAVISSRVKMDPKYLLQQERVADAALNYRLLGVAKDAFAQRKDMLIEICRREAKERFGGGNPAQEVNRLSDAIKRDLNRKSQE